MSEAALRERIARLRDGGSDASASLVDAALAVVMAVRGAVDAEAVASAFSDLEADARIAVPATGDLRERVGSLATWLGETCGFRGSRVHYHEVANSLIDEVLSRRRGIPVTLAIVYAEVARRLGVACVGVNFPGHFLVRFRDAADEQAVGILVDPFAHRILEPPELGELLRSTQGPEAQLSPVHLQDASPLAVLVRMLNNLKQLALSEERWVDALRFSDLILVAEPGLLYERVDRAGMYERMGDFDQALAELQILDASLAPGPSKERLAEQMMRLARRGRSGRRIH